MKHFRQITFIYFTLALLCFHNVAFASSTTTVTIKIPKDAHRMELFGKEFVLIGNAEIPPAFAEIRENWREILIKHNQDVFRVKNIPLPQHHKEQWKNLSRLLPKMTPLEKLRSINGFFNNIPSQQDSYTYKTKEHWATPEEFLRKRAGDCEDYAISKYFALQYFSWPLHDLWIVFLRDNINDGLHVVLATRHGDVGFVLDNLSKPAQLLIPEEQYSKQVRVIGVLNHLGMWLPLSEDKEK